MQTSPFQPHDHRTPAARAQGFAVDRGAVEVEGRCGACSAVAAVGAGRSGADRPVRG